MPGYFWPHKNGNNERVGITVLLNFGVRTREVDANLELRVIIIFRRSEAMLSRRPNSSVMSV